MGVQTDLLHSDETIAVGVMRVSHEGTDSNLADLLSKQLAGPRHHLLSSHILD